VGLQGFSADLGVDKNDVDKNDDDKVDDVSKDNVDNDDVIDVSYSMVESTGENGGDVVSVQPASKIEARRAKVWDLYARGVKITVIAEILKVHRNTVSNDLKILRERQGKVVKQLDAAATVGETLEFYDEIRRLSLAEYYAAGDLRGKNSFLQTALSAIKNKERLLGDCGLIPSQRKGGVNVQVNVANFSEQVAKKTSGMSIDELRSRKKELLERLGREK